MPVVVSSPVVPFEILRCDNKMVDEGVTRIFGKVKHYNEDTLNICRLTVNRGIDADYNEEKSDAETIYIVNRDGEKIEITIDMVCMDVFDEGSEPVLREQFDNATEIGDSFNYADDAGLFAEEWTIAYGLVQAIL